jgi:large subunit ribosomal protein L4
MDIPIYSMAGDRLDRFTVEEATLGGEPNFDLLRQAIIMYEANKRVGTVQAKRIDEVKRTSAKPWRQKHTGRARHGDRRSPLWVGGGVAHGPRPRDYRKKMTRPMRRRALQSAFLAKAADGEVLVVDEIALRAKKTREVATMLDNLGVERSFLIVLPEYDSELWRCTRNIPGAAMTRASDLNAYSMVRPRQVIFTRAGLDAFISHAARQKAEVNNG